MILLDQFVSSDEESQRHLKPERLGRLGSLSTQASRY